MDFINIWMQWIDYLMGWTGTIITVGINIGGLYLIYKIIKYFIRYHAECQNDFAEQREEKRRNQSKIEDINRELDEIEASLDAVQNEKITPIWDLPPKD